VSVRDAAVALVVPIIVVEGLLPEQLQRWVARARDMPSKVRVDLNRKVMHLGQRV
jgi:hypothetical protein